MAQDTQKSRFYFLWMTNI